MAFHGDEAFLHECPALVGKPPDSVVVAPAVGVGFGGGGRLAVGPDAAGAGGKPALDAPGAALAQRGVGRHSAADARQFYLYPLARRGSDHHPLPLLPVPGRDPAVLVDLLFRLPAKTGAMVAGAETDGAGDGLRTGGTGGGVDRFAPGRL